MLYTDTLILTTIFALGASGLFLWGAWKLLFEAKAKELEKKRHLTQFTLRRHAANPIMSPTSHEFEQQAVLNPTAVHDGSDTHLFYRAIGVDGVSRIGYAYSKDGVSIDDRLPYPVFALEGPDPHLYALRRAEMEARHPDLVASGGSWGGTEDPRAVIIDDRMYLTFSAFQNWDSVRIGVTSIAVDDLKQRKWKWTKPVFVSPEKQVHKNWVLFPEKLRGAFSFLHSISPKVEINYCVNLDAIGVSEPHLTSPQGARVIGRKGRWDTRMRGAGPSPIKTDKGWLLFYHATDHEKLSHLYQLGAMLLDKDDPSKVIAQSPVPVLTPSTNYEMSGAKPGIVYACGATAHDDQLNVYYGAADNYACVATTSLSQFVRDLVDHKPVLPEPKLALGL